MAVAVGVAVGVCVGVAVAVAGRMDYAALEALLREEADRLAGDPVAVRSR